MRRSAAIAVAAALCVSMPVSGRQLPGGPTAQGMVFGDVNYLHTQRDVAAGFRLGQLVGHLNAGLTDRLTFFGEVSLTPQTAGYALEVERAILRYDFSDVFKLSAGRYHTPISFWNVAYHHGSWLQSSVARPEMIRFGSRVLPVHFVGAMAEGNLPTPSLGLGYTLGIGNGRGANIARGGDAGDLNDHRAVTAGLRTRPPALSGFELGAGLYLDRVSDSAGEPVNERIVSAHVARQWESPEILAEYARIRHARAGSGPAATGAAYYAQLGFRLPGNAQGFKPYARYERIDLAADDPLLGGDELDYEAMLGGVRYDFAAFAALKAELRRERFTGPNWSNSVILQASFAVSGLAGGGALHHTAAPFPRSGR
jgi:hypothetical protein